MNDIYPVYLYPLPDAEGGGFAALAPDLHGCMSDGATQTEALENIQDAIAEWIHEAKRLGREIPAPGTAGQRAVRERQEMISIIRDQLGKIDGKVADLEKKVEAISAMMDQRVESYGWMVIMPPHSSGTPRLMKPH